MIKKFELRLGITEGKNIDGGLCYNEKTSIDISQSPYGGLINMAIDKGGILSKRNGQAYVISDWGGYVNGIYCDYKGFDIVHAGTGLYKGDLSNANSKDNLTLISSSLSNSKSKMFEFNNILYILDGNEYYQYDLEDFKAVEGYAPLVSINRKPDGSNSTPLESWNMLTSAFRNTFNGDGTSKVYQISFTSLDNKTPIVKVNNRTLTFNVDEAKSEYTVDYALGQITFKSPPSQGDANVEITAYRTFVTLRDNIVKCTLAVDFSSRMFFSGNTNEPNSYFASGITDSFSADYFPQKYLYKIGSSRAITGLKVHNNKLIVLKEDMICGVNYETGLDNSASFPITYLHTDVGCDIPGSVQSINNALVFGNSVGGIYTMTSTTVQDERAITNISKNINGGFGRSGLLTEVNIKNAISTVYDNKYILSIDDKSYVLDYRNDLHIKDVSKNRWFLWEHTKVINCYVISPFFGILYGTQGGIVKFISQKADFGKPIYSMWKSKVMDFDKPEFLKLITNMYITFNTETKSSTIKCYFLNEKGAKDGEMLLKGNTSFNWVGFNWEDFNFYIQNFNNTLKKKIRVKKVCYFQLEFENNTLNEDLAINNLVLEYRLLRKVR